MTTTTQHKHGWPFWIAVTLIVLPILYVGSFGPALWISSRADRGAEIVSPVYQPLMQFAEMEGSPLRKMCYRYAKLGAAEDWEIVVTIIKSYPDDDSLENAPVHSREVCEWCRIQHGGLGMF